MEETSQPLQQKSHGVLKKIVLFFGIAAAISLVFVAYQNINNTTAEEQTKVITQNQKTNTPASEVINGIAVPPEPSPTVNDSTLAGVDSNGNGVRDDVERIIAKKISSADQFTTWMVVAGVYQSILLSPTISQAEYEIEALKITCTDYKSLSISDSLNSNDILKSTLNTTQRQQDYKSKISMMPGRFVNPKAECK